MVNFLASVVMFGFVLAWWVALLIRHTDGGSGGRWWHKIPPIYAPLAVAWQCSVLVALPISIFSLVGLAVVFGACCMAARWRSLDSWGSGAQWWHQVSPIYAPLAVAWAATVLVGWRIW